MSEAFEFPLNTSPSLQKERGGGALVGLSSGCEIFPMGTEWPPVTLALANLFEPEGHITNCCICCIF